MLKALSVSKLRCWLTCPADFYDKYILGIEEYNPDFDFGSRYHKAVEVYHLTGETIDLIKAYTDIVPRDHVVEVEKPFEAILRHPETLEPLPLPFRGIIDAVGVSGALIDLKTSEKSWSQRKADEDLQATAYLYYWWQEHGELPEFNFVVARKHPTPRIKPLDILTTKRTIQDFANFWLLANKTIKDIQAEETWACRCYNQAHTLERMSA